jgi:surface antigen
MQAKIINFLKFLTQKAIFRLVCFFRFCLKCQKYISSLKNTPTVIWLAIFIVFSCLETASIVNKNSFENTALNKLIWQKQEITIETGLPTVTNQAEKEKAEFKIAAWREDENPSEDILDISDDSEIALILGESVLMTPETNLNENNLPIRTRTEIEKYTVQPGDTISSIAENFGLNWNTILWENKLNYWSVIRPGNELKILPTDGLSSQVKKDETLTSLAKKYGSSVKQIAEFNNLNEDSILVLGEILIIPGGTPPAVPVTPVKKPKITPTKPVIVQENYSGYWDWRENTDCHRFVARQCTDWSAFKWAAEQKQCVPSWGNAKSWLPNAKRDGYETGSEPRKGAIMALTCTSWICGYYGHVAYVESFDNNTVTFSEMNGLKRRDYSLRSLDNATGKWQGGWKIVGYIYPR